MADLRPYQSEALARLVRVLHRRPVLVAPTGSGKTVMATHLIRRLNAPALWVAHRRELINQAASHLRKLGMPTNIIMGGETSSQESLFDQPTQSSLIHVASVQTLVRREFPAGVAAIFVDEAHHATSSSYADLFTADQSIPIVGLTATPFRLDGQPLGDLFGAMVVVAQVADLVGGGFLHAPRVFTPYLPDLHGVRMTAGDYNLREVGDVMGDVDLVGRIVTEWQRRAAGRRTVCFAVNVKHSTEIVGQCLAAGIAAEHLDGSTPSDQRDAILARLRSGETTIVSNCMVLTEGWDLPALECAIIARPTASLNLHLQMLGRVMRAADGKSEAIVLDHAGNHHRHGPVTRRLEYSLTAPARSSPGEPLGLKRCKTCGLMLDLGVAVCPDCGTAAEVVVERAIEHADGDLREFDDSTWEYRAAFWASTEAERLAGGFSEGWAAYRFKKRFGEWPKLIESADADGVVVLHLVNWTDRSVENRRRVYEHYLTIAEINGYKRGWASVRYKDVFGTWPQGFVGAVTNERAVASLAVRFGKAVAS